MYTLITGASGGIGRELALQAAHDGHRLILVARNESPLRQLADSLDVEVHTVVCDLSVAHSATELALTLKKNGWSVSQLINNAGVGDYGEFVSSQLSTQLGTIQLNITSLTELTHLLLPDIISHKGKIMNVGSVASFMPGPLMSVYFASKQYVLSFSEALHQELKSTDVTVTCLCPGPTATHFGSTAHVSDTHGTADPKTTAASVARIGWKAMQRGDAIVINSLRYRVAVFLITRLLPRAVVRRIVMRVQR